MKARPMTYTEAIGLALVIAAVLGGWARFALERPGDSDKACVLRLEPGGGDVVLWNLHCSHLAEMRALDRTMLAANIRAGNAQAGIAQVINAPPHAGTAFAATGGQRCRDGN